MNRHLFGQVPCRSRTDARDHGTKPEGSESSKSADLDDRGHEARHRDRSTRIDIGHPEMNRSGTRLKQERKQGEENAHTVNHATACDDRGENMRRTGSTVNECHAVQENRAEHRTRNEVLESTFVRVDVLTAKTHQGINREASEFHTQVKGEEIDCLRHEQGSACCKQQQAISFATLELLVTESPLETGNTEKSAKDNRDTEHAADRVHGVQVHKGVVRREIIGTSTEHDKEACHPRKHLVLVVVLDERFRGERHEGTDRDQNYGQEIHDITHFQKPPRLLWPRFVQELRQLRFRSSP